MPRIVDYSVSHPTNLDGFDGAMRYLGVDSRCINAADRDRLHGMGKGIGLIYETSANRTLSGAAGGVEDAKRANDLADALGAPAWVPIFGTAVDFEPSDAQLGGPIAEYCHGGNTIGGRPWEAYGTYRAIEHLVGGGIARRGWQCCAWSYYGTGTGGRSEQGFRLSAHASMFQRLGYVLGNTCDDNEIYRPIDWLWFADGQQPSAPPGPTPAPQPEEKHMSEVVFRTLDGSEYVMKAVDETRVFTLPDGMTTFRAEHGYGWHGFEGPDLLQDAALAGVADLTVVHQLGVEGSQQLDAMFERYPIVFPAGAIRPAAGG